MEQEQQYEHLTFNVDGVDMSEVEIAYENPVLRHYLYEPEKHLFSDVRKMEAPQDPKDEQEQSKDKKKDDASYLRVDQSYNYGDEVPAVSEFYTEGPVFQCNGLKCRVTKGKESWSLLVIFNMDNPEHAAYVDYKERKYMRTAQYLSSIKGKLKMHLFNADSLEMAAATGLKFPIAYPRDETTSEIIEGSSPFEWINLVGGGKYKTVFTFPGAGRDEKIDWRILQRSRFKFIPCFYNSHIYIGGGKMSMQDKLSSAVVVDIEPNTVVPRNIGTADALATAIPGLSDKMRSQIEYMTTIKMAEEEPDAGTKTVPEGETGQAVFSGVNGTATNSASSTPLPAKTPANVKAGVTPSVKGSGATPKMSGVPGGKSNPTRTPAARGKFN
jgi:hypothetical protein